MKYKTTAKAIRESAHNPRFAGYCDLQYLLRDYNPIAYTCGIYGWNFDVYRVYGVTICTGYRGMVGKRLDGVAEYERKAEAIYHDKTLTYEQARERNEELLHEFCKLNGGY